MTEEELNVLAIHMFRTFARCEYALKAADFLVGDERSVRADWSGFAESVKEHFANPAEPELAAAITYMLEHPPNKQVMRDQKLDFVEALPDSQSHADLIFKYVLRVRNNLFHGGKFNGHWFAPERSEELITHSLVILRAGIAASDRVRAEYGQD